MRVNCYLCGHPQEAPELDDLMVQRLAKDSDMSIEELRNTRWKYVCSDCTKTEKYWEWASTEDAKGHMALTKEAKVIEQ